MISIYHTPLSIRIADPPMMTAATMAMTKVQQMLMGMRMMKMIVMWLVPQWRPMST